MEAALLSIGDELAIGQCIDTNSAWLADRLLAWSVVTVEHRTIADDRALIATAVEELVRRADLLILTGGLGPTEDDLTREALGDVVSPGKPLVTDEEALRSLRRWFAGRQSTMPERNVVQAARPEAMRMLPNRWGTAPGLAGEHGDCRIFALPGPPREMRPMFEAHVEPTLEMGGADGRIVTESVHAFGIGESDAAERLGELAARGRNPLVGTTASEGILSARIRADGESAGLETMVAESVRRIEEAWWPYAFGRGTETLAEAVGCLLREHGRTMATAESCTGGWLGKTIVDVSGSSEYYLGGWVTYSNEMKIDRLGVPPALLASAGAVSAEVARAMAAGALDRSGADEALSITGVAGPGDGGPDKPAGTVYVALARRAGAGRRDCVRQFRFRGDRQTVRDRSVKSALQMLRFALLDVSDEQPMLWSTRSRREERVEGDR
jgi:nicotinamide-nucleotide amidase